MDFRSRLPQIRLDQRAADEAYERMVSKQHKESYGPFRWWDRWFPDEIWQHIDSPRFSERRWLCIALVITMVYLAVNVRF